MSFVYVFLHSLFHDPPNEHPSQINHILSHFQSGCHLLASSFAMDHLSWNLNRDTYTPPILWRCFPGEDTILFCCVCSWDVWKPVGAAENVSCRAAVDVDIRARTFCRAFQLVGSRASDSGERSRAVHGPVREIVWDAEDPCRHREPTSGRLVCRALLHAFYSIVRMPSVLWHCWLGGRKGIRPVKNMGDGGGYWLVRMEWRPAGWSVCLPVLISSCTIKSRSSLLAPAHPVGPGKRAVKRLWCGGG